MLSMSESAASGKALTDKQGDLACRLILKYQKQLASLGINVTPVETPEYRIPLRVIDRRRILLLEPDHISLQFPYDTKLIDDIRDLSKMSHGAWVFHQAEKIWKISITEMNIIAVGGFAKIHNFEIDSEFLKLEQVVVDCESIPYAIELQFNGDELSITNAAPSLVSYINAHVGGFGKDNIMRLVDNAGRLGYTVNKQIQEIINRSHSCSVLGMMVNQQTKLTPVPDDVTFTDVLEYSMLSERLPIYVYEPDRSDKLLKNFVEKYFTTDEILILTSKHTTPDIAGKRIIYFNKYNINWEHPIPLLLSGAGMMHGGDKTILLQRAEKVVYFAAEVYNQNSNNRTKAKSIDK
jgi:hypothetical protein